MHGQCWHGACIGMGAGRRAALAWAPGGIAYWHGRYGQHCHGMGAIGMGGVGMGHWHGRRAALAWAELAWAALAWVALTWALAWAALPWATLAWAALAPWHGQQNMSSDRIPDLLWN